MIVSQGCSNISRVEVSPEQLTTAFILMARDGAIPLRYSDGSDVPRHLFCERNAVFLLSEDPEMRAKVGSNPKERSPLEIRIQMPDDVERVVERYLDRIQREPEIVEYHMLRKSENARILDRLSIAVGIVTFVLMILAAMVLFV